MAVYSYSRGGIPGGSFETMPSGGALAVIPSTRVAGGIPFRGAMQGLGRAAKFGGYGLAGLGIVLGAADELNRVPGDTAGNLAAAGGSLAGGVGGGVLGGMGAGAAGALLGLKGGPLAPLTVPIGFALGSMAGGSIGGAGGRAAAGIAERALGGDPQMRALNRQIEQNELLARSLMNTENEAALSRLPTMQAYAAAQREQDAMNSQLALQNQALSMYAQQMLGPSQVPAGAYRDPNLSNALAQIAMRGLG